MALKVLLKVFSAALHVLLLADELKKRIPLLEATSPFNHCLPELRHKQSIPANSLKATEAQYWVSKEETRGGWKHRRTVLLTEMQTQDRKKQELLFVLFNLTCHGNETNAVLAFGSVPQLLAAFLADVSTSRNFRTHEWFQHGTSLWGFYRFHKDRHLSRGRIFCKPYKQEKQSSGNFYCIRHQKIDRVKSLYPCWLKLIVTNKNCRKTKNSWFHCYGHAVFHFSMAYSEHVQDSTTDLLHHRGI